MKKQRKPNKVHAVRRSLLGARERKRGVIGIVARLCFVAVIGCCILLALTIFFPIRHMELIGTERYQAKEMEQALGVSVGDNLFLWQNPRQISKVFKQYPYIQSIEIQRKLPSTLVIQVEESTPFGTVMSAEGGYDIISTRGKILEHRTDVAPSHLPKVVGVTIEQPAGETLRGQDSASIRALLVLLQQASKADLLNQLDRVDVSNPTSIVVGYGKRLEVRLGTVGEMARKLQFLKTIVQTKLSPSDTGVIDLTNLPKASFWPVTQKTLDATAQGNPTPSALNEQATQEEVNE